MKKGIYAMVPLEAMGLLKGNEIFVYTVLMSYCGQEMKCWPSYPAIRRRMGIHALSLRSIQTIVKKLQKKGLLKIQYRKGTSSIYHMTQFLDDYLFQPKVTDQTAIKLLENAKRKEKSPFPKATKVGATSLPPSLPSAPKSMPSGEGAIPPETPKTRNDFIPNKPPEVKRMQNPHNLETDLPNWTAWHIRGVTQNNLQAYRTKMVDFLKQIQRTGYVPDRYYTSEDFSPEFRSPELDEQLKKMNSIPVPF
jgi:predicted DNA-binding transcriptional regulator